MRDDRRAVHRLVLDPILCEGNGVCAQILPESITLDEWGYPILRDDRVTPELLHHATRAVQACPRLALALVAVDTD